MCCSCVANPLLIRGLIAVFRRGGKPFFAVKAPWYAVPKKHLWALLGPNGAGKTTTVNMLTGFIPPSRGNALVTGCTVAHPVGMSRVRRRMGVCPQVSCRSLLTRVCLSLPVCILLTLVFVRSLTPSGPRSRRESTLSCLRLLRAYVNRPYPMKQCA
jgi:ABC-type Mn2+/Zn2+ transport system ATPase subunit